ncbi:MAG TPA: hypothetical protein VN457_01385, partial [Chlamydiales bacterium]|nr:hypothetical protein [Chlamydiales bacterium]
MSGSSGVSAAGSIPSAWPGGDATVTSVKDRLTQLHAITEMAKKGQSVDTSISMKGMGKLYADIQALRQTVGDDAANQFEQHFAKAYNKLVEITFDN